MKPNLELFDKFETTISYAFRTYFRYFKVFLLLIFNHWFIFHGNCMENSVSAVALWKSFSRFFLDWSSDLLIIFCLLPLQSLTYSTVLLRCQDLNHFLLIFLAWKDRSKRRYISIRRKIRCLVFWYFHDRNINGWISLSLMENTVWTITPSCDGGTAKTSPKPIHSWLWRFHQ